MREKKEIAYARIRWWRQRCREGHVDGSAGIELELSQYSAVAVNCCGDAIVGSPKQGQALLDRTHARLMEVLAGARGVAEPAVVGGVDDQPRPLGTLHDRSGNMAS